MLTLAAIEEARELLSRFMQPTPQYVWPLLDAQLDCRVVVKHENHAPTGSFKVRGAIAYIHEQALHQPRGARFVTATTGNHGLGLAFACQKFGYTAAAVMPVGAALGKTSNLQAMGCFVVEHGHSYLEAEAYSQGLAQEQGFVHVPSFHHAFVCGAATYVMELIAAHQELDALFLPIGMGAGICGALAVRDALALDLKIIGVAHKSSSLSQGEGAGACRTFADGMACSQPSGAALAQIRAGCDALVFVDDDEIAEAIRVLYRCCHNLAEGAGAAALAGVMQTKASWRGKQVGIPLCGQNIDRVQMRTVLSGATPSPQ
ncbi:threonine dehydratase [Polycladidibacter hongkongensis]|uniref:threonine dehydratase n=1 Tax=Polycladidibacter hongkongensis TaxID=1647556 RepID=UPI00082B9B0B|nr:threonine dehydratase [Pseudovibrio hongkongensis]